MAEIYLFSIHGIHYKPSLCQIQNGFYGIRQPFFNAFLYNQTVHYNLYIMLDIFIQLDFFAEFVQISVNLYTHITTFSSLLQKFGMGSFSPSYHRCQKLNFRSFRQPHNMIYHLVYSLFPNFPPALGTMGNPHTGVEKSKIIVDFRNRSHGRTRISVGRFLVNGNGRRKSLNTLHIRLLHLPQELSGIRRK